MIDVARLARALMLDADRAGDGWLVTGGDSSWLVDDATGCPCPDRQIRGPGCKHETRVRLAVLDADLLEALRALVSPTATPRGPEVVRRGATQRDVSALERPDEPGLPPEAFQPPTRSRRGGARRRCACGECAA